MEQSGRWRRSVAFRILPATLQHRSWRLLRCNPNIAQLLLNALPMRTLTCMNHSTPCTSPPLQQRRIAPNLNSQPPFAPCQVCVLYPLETIKVKCQADGVSAAVAVQQMFGKGPFPAMRQLYSGMGAAAFCSIIVGAVHYASFCMSKRAAMAAADVANGNGGGAVKVEEGGQAKGAATAFAAVVGAMATALVESPCDLYRHMAQARAAIHHQLQ